LSVHTTVTHKRRRPYLTLFTNLFPVSSCAFWLIIKCCCFNGCWCGPGVAGVGAGAGAGVGAGVGVGVGVGSGTTGTTTTGGAGLAGASLNF